MQGVLGTKLQVIDTARRYAILAAEAIMELRCQAELIESKEKCYTALPVIRTGDWQVFVDIRRWLLQDVTIVVSCTADTMIYFCDHRGAWHKKSKTLVLMIALVIGGFNSHHFVGHPITKIIALYSDFELEAFKSLTFVPCCKASNSE